MLRFCKDLRQAGTCEYRSSSSGFFGSCRDLSKTVQTGYLAVKFFHELLVAFLEALLLDLLLDLFLSVQEARPRQFLPLHDADDVESASDSRIWAELPHRQAEDRLIQVFRS